MLVVAGIGIVVRGKPFADLHQREHAAHLDRSEGTEARHHRQRVVGHRHLHRAHCRHSVRPHRHVVGHELAHAAGKVALVDADEVFHVMAHGVHGVVGLVAMERPIAGRVGHHVEGAYCANGNIYRCLRPLRAFRHPAAVGTGHREAVTMQMDRMMIHRSKVSEADPDLVVLADDQGVDAREHAAVPAPHVELGHLGDARHIGAGLDVEGVEQEDEVAIDAAPKLGIARVHDEHPHHPHRHLHHLVRVRVVHERAASLHLELVDEGLAGLDVRLGHAADAVHAVGQQHAVPMHGRVLGQLVGDEDAQLVAFDGLDRGARRLAVVAPQVHLHAGRELAHDRLGDEVKLLPVAVHAPRQGPAVERDHGLIVGAARGDGRRLHRGGGRPRRLGDSGGLRTAAHRARAREHGGGAEKASS